MKVFRTTKWLRTMMLFILLTHAFSAAWASETMTLIGEINDNYQLIADGRIYEIADTPEGNELAENHINAQAKVTGTVENRDDMLIITVTSFEILNE